MSDTSYTGYVTGVRDSYEKRTTADVYSTKIRWACFTKTPFTQAVGVESFGVDAMKDLQKFGQARPTGRIITVNPGGYALRGTVFSTSGSSFHVAPMGNWQAQYVAGGDEYAYSWMTLANVKYIPREEVQDNQGPGQLISVKQHRMEMMKQEVVRDFNYAILGNSSAPGYDTEGPSARYTDLPNLISVDQTRTVGAISATNSFWQNGYKEVLSIGGGGEFDRPLLLRRSWLKARNDQAKHAEGSLDYLYLATQGFYQFYDRLMYADAVQSGAGGAFGAPAKYDAVGIEMRVFERRPVIWDPAVQIPYGATAGTEAVYGIHIPSYFISIKSQANFLVSDWEEPREHDLQKTLVASFHTRYCPGVVERRPHFTLYNMPACVD